MKLTAGRVFDVLPAITQIINEDRPMPQKGKYRLARLYSKLLPEFEVIAKQRDALIRAYDSPQMMSDNGVLVPTGEFTVPFDKLAEFNLSWAEIAKEEIDVDIQPIPFAHLDLGDDRNGALSAAELIALGDLVAE